MLTWNSHLASLKAAAAVYAALHVTVGTEENSELKKQWKAFFSKPGDDLWTPTLKFYTTYEASDLVSLSTAVVFFVKLFLNSDSNSVNICHLCKRDNNRASPTC